MTGPAGHGEPGYHTAVALLPKALWLGSWPVLGKAPWAKGNEV